jgi:hypothetical protein
MSAERGWPAIRRTVHTWWAARPSGRFQIRSRPRFDHLVLLAGYAHHHHGWVELGKLYYELWDFGDGHMEGCIDKLSARYPRRGIGGRLLQELHRRRPEVQQWWTTPHVGDGETFWPYMATKHEYAYAVKTRAERRRELFGVSPDALRLLLWGVGSQRPGFDSVFREVDADLRSLAGGEQAPFAELAAQLDPAWAERAREGDGWIAIYDNARPDTLTSWVRQLPGLVGSVRLAPGRSTPS